MGTIRLVALMKSASKYTYRGKSCSIAEQVAKKLLGHALLFVCNCMLTLHTQFTFFRTGTSPFMYKSINMKEKQYAYRFYSSVKRHDVVVLSLPLWRGPSPRSGVLGSPEAQPTPHPACRTSLRLFRSVPTRQKKYDAWGAENRDVRCAYVWVNVTDRGCLTTKHTTAHRELTNPTGPPRIRIHHASPLLLVPLPSKTTEADLCGQLHEV